MDFSIIVVWLIVNAVLAIPVVYVAGKKGYDQTNFFWLSFLFSFVVALLVLVALPNKLPIEVSARDEDDVLYAQCPYCKEEIRSDAVVCKHCGRDVIPTIDAKRELQAVRNQERIELEKAKEAEFARKREIAERENARIVKWVLIIAGSIAAIAIIGTVAFNVLTKPTATEVAEGFQSALSDCEGTIVSPATKGQLSPDGQTLTLSGDESYMSCVIKAIEPTDAQAVIKDTIGHPRSYSSSAANTFPSASTSYDYQITFGPETVLVIKKRS